MIVSTRIMACLELSLVFSLAFRLGLNDTPVTDLEESPAG